MKRNLSFFLIILSVVICITACSGGGSNGDGNGDVTPPADSSAVFDTDNPPIVIYAEGIPTDVQATIYQALKSVYGTPPEYTYDPSESDGKHEIIIGKTNLSISREAYRRLRAYTSSDNYESTFVIYAEGSSVAIAYDEDSVGFACAEGVRYFAENYVIGKTELTLNEGVVASKTVSVLDHYAALDAKNRETAFNTLAAHIGGDLGAELVSAMKELYAIYNPDVITWFANLYDPCVGGFYFSNSARDKHGFLPDLESTGQALFFIEGSGMLSGTGSSSFASILSDETKAQIAKFIRSCQDPNGYFYHPQWSKAETDAHLSRRARDLSYAVSVLEALGRSPVYDTPTGVKGDGLPVARVVTVPLSASTAALASCVTAAASHDPNFESLDTLKKYLNSLADSGQHFYPIGNELSSQIGQIMERDRELGLAGKDESLTGYVIKWLDGYQDPTNGTWDKSGGYDGVNALLKISSIYNSAGYAMSYHEEAAKTAMQAIISDEEKPSIVYIYNTWYATFNVIKNLRLWGGSGANDRAAALLSELYAIAPEALRATANELLLFRMKDGSFNYDKYNKSTVSQGMVVADPDDLEGTVNSTVIAINSIMGIIYNALDVAGYNVPIFGQRELYVFLDTLNNLDPVIKKD